MDDQRVREAGHQLSSKNESDIKAAFTALASVLKRAFGGTPSNNEEGPANKLIRDTLARCSIDQVGDGAAPRELDCRQYPVR